MAMYLSKVGNTRENGDTSGTTAIRARICKATNQSDAYRTMAADAVENSLQHAYNQGDIDGYEIKEYNTGFSTSGGDVLQEWSDALKETTNPDQGAWMVVHGASSGTVNAAWSPGAWDGAQYAVVSTTKNANDGMFKNLAIHEVLHTYLNQHCSEVQNLTGDENTDHSLGRDYIINGDDYRSPMSTGHGEKSGAGNCSRWEGLGVSYRQDMSSCTRTALKESGEHSENSNHA